MSSVALNVVYVQANVNAMYRQRFNKICYMLCTGKDLNYDTKTIYIWKSLIKNVYTGLNECKKK